MTFNVRLIHPPTLAHRVFLAFSEECLQIWREFYPPAVNIGIADLDAAIFHHFLQVQQCQQCTVTKSQNHDIKMHRQLLLRYISFLNMALASVSSEAKKLFLSTP
jgi:hypothetical protein